MLRPVPLVRTDVSEELLVFLILVGLMIEALSSSETIVLNKSHTA
jgi:hypothetical protein